jgi:hypothetical protein
LLDCGSGAGSALHSAEEREGEGEELGY